MSLRDLELADEFDGITDIRDNVHRIHNELGDIFGEGLDGKYRKTVLRDVVAMLKEGVKMLRIVEDNEDNEVLDDVMYDTAYRMNNFFETACQLIDACASGSGRGKGGKGLGKGGGSGISIDEYNENKKIAKDALEKFFKFAKKEASPARVAKANTTQTKSRCPRGTRRNKKTGNCESTTGVKNASPPQIKAKTARCPRGSRRNKKTGNCDKK